MTDAMDFIPVDFHLPHMVAVALIFGLWGFYTPILRIIGRGSLNTQLHAVRLRWLSSRAMARRPTPTM